jgi:transcriptional regulator GlxA family with amidase domain
MKGHFAITLFPSRRNASKTPCASRDPYPRPDNSFRRRGRRPDGHAGLRVLPRHLLSSIDLFASLSTPIVERFEPSDELGSKLQAALAEISGRQVGMQAMTTAILKQVLVTLVRRSLNSTSAWLERLSILSDRQIARAFADMVALPSADHSVMALAQKAALSRSAFMARFVRAIGCSPMVALRQMRMKRAADMLAARAFPVEQIARAVGYKSRSSFLRAFRQVHGYVPAESERNGQNSD